MKLYFHLSGSVLYSTSSNVIPTIGSIFRVKTETYKKGLFAGSIIQVRISEEAPPEIDYTEGPEGAVYIDLDGYEILQEGTNPGDE